MDALLVVRREELRPDLGQTPGMERYAGVAAATVGARGLWVGYVTMAPGSRSGPHHHGDCESAIYIVRGRARFRFGPRLEEAVEAGPGDFVYVPPRLVHQEINLSQDEAIEMVVVRDSQENVVVNVELPEE